MNFSPCKHLLSSTWGRVFIAFFVLAVIGAGGYFYTHIEAKLTFHPDWTETDRRQIREIWELLEKQKVVQDQRKQRDFDRILNRIGKGKEFWEDSKEYVAKYYIQDEASRVEDVILETAKTGDASYVGKGNWTLLMLACSLGKPELACRLVEKGADVNIEPKDALAREKTSGTTAVFWLLEGYREKNISVELTLQMLEKLASHGANMNVEIDGISLFQMTCMNLACCPVDEQERIMFKLMDLGMPAYSPSSVRNNWGNPLRISARSGLKKVVRRLCEMGVNVNEGDRATAPLFFVNYRLRPENQVEIARTLLDYGARINGCDPLWTPLGSLASSIDYRWELGEESKACLLALFDLYLERGALVNHVSPEGKTPLMYLFERESRKPEWRQLQVELARKLLSHGADPFLKNREGETVYDLIKRYDKNGSEIQGKLPELLPGK